MVAERIPPASDIVPAVSALFHGGVVAGTPSPKSSSMMYAAAAEGEGEELGDCEELGLIEGDTEAEVEVPAGPSGRIAASAQTLIAADDSVPVLTPVVPAVVWIAPATAMFV
jgi:hypothetical protein